ncbi:LexA family transcriptional regulator [Stutzerimonas nitrititolerans]|uniref:LexA family transcriptional regulator n=1 Tax=Stutzerimonas nitrititolerans TaxID=2482751 RepID=UPI00289D8A83|nr:LexA family transcriptional regulator [Stutzerimonas nitrititolerans]
MDSHLSVTTPDSSIAVFYQQENSSCAVCEDISTANTVRAMKAPRRELTSGEQAECARLKAIFEKRQKEAKDQGVRITQESLGNSIGWKSGQSAVNQYLNGKVPLNLEALLKFAAELRFAPEEVSPRLAAEIAGLTMTAEKRPVGTVVEISPGTDEGGSPSSDDYALIPQYTAKGSSGNGYLNDHVEIKGGLAFKRDWLCRMGLKPDNLRVAYNHGDSNWPTLTDGEVVLLDVAAIEPANGKMFALLDPDGEMIFKRLIRDIKGGWLIRSDNDNKTLYPDMPISDEGIRGVDIVGRIVWRGGAM